MTETAPLADWQPAGGFGHEGQLKVVTVEEFAAVDEPGAEPLLGSDGQAVIPEDSDVMVFGDGGAGKTTLMNDFACHAAAGDDWLGITIPRPLRVLIVENEGPRPLFRAKLRRKLEGWDGSEIGDRLLVIEAPWASVTFDDESCRNQLADVIRSLEIDVVVVGPLSRSGMNDAGTLQEVRDFLLLVNAVRRLADRHVTIILVHHEAKGGKVSGSWEGSGDTLLHVQAQGHGRTRLFVQKARWASDWHGKTLNLLWGDGETFKVEDAPELDDEAIADQIVTYISENPGTGWTKVEQATPGVRRDRRRNIRDGLFADRRIANIVKEDGQEALLWECPERKTCRLYLADDPTIQHLRPGPGADGAQTAPALGENRQTPSAPCAPPIRGRRSRGADSPPPETGPNDPADGGLEWR